MRIPMQVYLDQEMIEFYKEYARQQGKSFAELMREIMEESKSRIMKTKKVKSLNKKIKDRHQYLLETINIINKRFAKTKYHYPKLNDDELLYDKFAR